MRRETGHSGDRRLPKPIYHWAAVNKLKAGQGYVEYGLILMLIGLTVIGALTLLGQQLHELWHSITTAMPR
jgi:Flp pilus assembly pilin Flp